MVVAVRVSPALRARFEGLALARGWSLSQGLERAMKGLLVEAQGGVPELGDCDEVLGALEGSGLRADPVEIARRRERARAALGIGGEDEG